MIATFNGKDKFGSCFMSVKFRHRRRCFKSLFFLLLISINFVVIGAQADRYFDIGIKAARQQQYEVALKAFLQAKSAGLNTAELHYNLGVTYYKLEQYGKAADSFRHLVRNSDYSAVAFYNLGLVDLKLGKPDTAKDWFSKAYSTTADANLKSLSQLALQRVDEDSAAGSSIFGGWHGFISGISGYDDNVSLIDEDLRPTNTSTDDSYQELTMAVTRTLWGTPRKGIQFIANGDILKQQTEHRYDFSQWHVGLTHTTTIYGWNTSASVAIDRMRFANASFQRINSLEFRGSRRISGPTSMELGYSYANIEDQSPNGIYSYLEGNLHQFRLRLTDKVKNVGFKYLYVIQINNRQDYHKTTVVTDVNNSTSTTTTVNQSYSPLRNMFQVTADVPLAKKLALLVGAQYRYSYYRDRDTENKVVRDSNGVSSTSTTSLQREDHRYNVNLGVQYSYTPDWQFFSNYSYTKNVSNRTGSDYKRSLVSAGVSWFF